MRRWTLRLAAVAAVLVGVVLAHQGLVLGTQMGGPVARLTGSSCAMCH